MHKIKKLYFPFTRAGIQELLAYRMNFLCFFIGELFYCFVMYYVWKAVFESSGSGTFMDFSMNDMVVYLFISNVTGFITSSNVCEQVGDEIKDGSISMRLIKPVNCNLSYLFKELGQLAILLTIIFVPMVLGVEIYRYCVNGFVMFNIVNFLFYILSALFAYLISFYLNLCFGFMAFFVKNLWGFNILKNSLIRFLSGAVIPLAFMPGIIRQILELMPFASLSYTPVMLYMGKYDTQQIVFNLLLQLFWLMFFYVLSKLIWKKAIKYLCVQGG